MRIIEKAISTFVIEELYKGYQQWSGAVEGVNGFIYGIPCNSRRVMKFYPMDKSFAYIGPDLGGGEWDTWVKGAMANNGVIYCLPANSYRGILKINTNTDNVTELDINFPERGGSNKWLSCDLALDGCIYFMPNNARRIFKLDPNNGDAVSSVGDDLGKGKWKYMGTVVGCDGCVYGMPNRTNRIIKYDPVNDTTSFVGEKADEDFLCTGGALGRDGCIYALTKDGRVLKIDTTKNVHCFVGNRIAGCHLLPGYGWKDAILGVDGCIYWPPRVARRVLKYDPHTNQTLLVGDDYDGVDVYKWVCGVLASNGNIYCFPFSGNRILFIDPLKEFSATTKLNMKGHPEELGYLFRRKEEDTTLSLTDFDHAVKKFGIEKVFKVLEECMPPMHKVYSTAGLCPFVIAASLPNVPLSVIYFMFRETLSVIDL